MTRIARHLLAVSGLIACAHCKDEMPWSKLKDHQQAAAPSSSVSDRMDLQPTPPAAAAADESCKEAEVKEEADFEMESAEGAAAAASSSAAAAAASSSSSSAVTASPLASALSTPPLPCVGCEVCPRGCEDPQRRGSVAMTCRRPLSCGVALGDDTVHPSGDSPSCAAVLGPLFCPLASRVCTPSVRGRVMSRSARSDS
jgi:hypothetical protein